MLWAKLYWSMIVPHTLTLLFRGQWRFAAISDMTAGGLLPCRPFRIKSSSLFVSDGRFTTRRSNSAFSSSSALPLSGTLYRSGWSISMKIAMGDTPHAVHQSMISSLSGLVHPFPSSARCALLFDAPCDLRLAQASRHPCFCKCFPDLARRKITHTFTPIKPVCF